MSIRMRRPATVRLELEGGDTLTVKQDLTAGEYRDFLRASSTATAGSLALDPFANGVALVLAYLLDWTFQDADGRPLVIADQPRDVVRSVLDHLDADAYMEVQRAIQAHQTGRAEALEAEKKMAIGVT